MVEFRIGLTDQVSPYAFADVAWGRAYGYEGVLGPVPRNDASLASLGVCLDYTLNRNLTATLVGAVALTDALYTKAGDLSIQARVFVSY